MKKSFIYLFAVILSIGFMVSCGSDEPKGESTLAELLKKAAGSYKGKLKITINTEDPITEDATIDISQASDSTVKFTLTGLKVGEIMSFAPIVLETVSISKNGEKVDIKAAKISTKVYPLENDGTPSTDGIPVEISVDGNINGNNIKTQVDVLVDLSAPEKISVKAEFAGNK